MPLTILDLYIKICLLLSDGYTKLQHHYLMVVDPYSKQSMDSYHLSREIIFDHFKILESSFLESVDLHARFLVIFRRGGMHRLYINFCKTVLKMKKTNLVSDVEGPSIID